ncbi:TPA: hypothetical protein ACH3X2_008048 [Trebouxia sp. C0005]
MNRQTSAASEESESTGAGSVDTGLPFEGRKQALPASPSQVEQAGQDVTASDRTLSVIIRDRGGTLPKEMPSAQERLKAVLTEDRQDAPPPGSQIREGHQVMATVMYPHDEPLHPFPGLLRLCWH